MSVSLQPELQNRYSRQILFRPIGIVGQEKLSKSSVVIIGLGALEVRGRSLVPSPPAMITAFN